MSSASGESTCASRKGRSSHAFAENAIHPAPTTAPPTATMRGHRPGTSAGTSARSTTASASTERLGSSMLSQEYATAIAGSTQAASVLPIRAQLLCERGEGFTEVLPAPNGRDRDPRSREPERTGRRTRGPPGVARGVHPYDGHEPATREPEYDLDRPRIEVRGDDDELTRMRRGRLRPTKPAPDAVRRVRLGSREHAERRREVAVERRHGLRSRLQARCGEDRAPAAGHVGAQDRACRTYGRIEARLRRLPRDSRGVAVEDDRDGVAGRVLELFHHELPPPRRRRPVNAAQGLALGVLAHGVEVEAGGS